MSVVSPRLAAAQRTAALKRSGSKTRRRFVKFASWAFILPMLALFSFSLVANARTFGKPDYAEALRHLQAGRPLVLLKANGNQVLCSISSAQAAALSAHWQTSQTTLSVDGKSVPALSVDAPNEKELREYLGVSAVDCKAVRKKSIFYLPFNLEPGE
jgi:hypothetical protein